MRDRWFGFISCQTLKTHSFDRFFVVVGGGRPLLSDIILVFYGKGEMIIALEIQYGTIVSTFESF